MPKNMSLKSFHDQLEAQLAVLSVEELRSVLRGMARNVSPHEREAFLERLTPETEDEASETGRSDREDLVADVEGLAGEIQSEMETAEYWDEDRHYGRGYYDDDYYDDEDSLGPYEQYTNSVEDLFGRAQSVFDAGDRKQARQAYEKLFVLVGLEDEYGRGITWSDLTNVDRNETWGRYLRTLYETVSKKDRCKDLYDAMQKMPGAPWGGPGIGIDSLVEISPEPLKGWDKFLEDWTAFLSRQKDSRADRWLREAVKLKGGAAGLQEFAREQGKARPRAFVDWVAALAEEEKQAEVVAAAQEALAELPATFVVRAEVADYLSAAAEALSDPKLVRQAKWEAFAADPDLKRLLDLWNAQPEGVTRKKTMAAAAKHVEEYLQRPSPDYRSDSHAAEGLEEWTNVSKLLLVHAHLLSGNWQAARRLAQVKKAIGWTYSDNPQGIVVPACLVVLSGDADSPPSNVARQWEQALSRSRGHGYYVGIEVGDDEDDDEDDDGGEGEEGSESGKSFLSVIKAAYRDAMGLTPIPTADQQKVLKWCLDVSRRRVREIVGKQRRKSYGKAATLAVSCAETLAARGKQRQAETLLNQIKDEFPRHRAFQQELKTAQGLPRR